MRTTVFLFITLWINVSLFAQKTITGTVSDETGPLPGVSVLIQGTQNGTETDFDGKYTIIAKEADILVYTFIGKKTKKVTIGSTSVYNVSLEDAGTVLDEVVVTGYGRGIRRTKAFCSVNNNHRSVRRKRSKNNVTNTLAGRIQGVQVTRASGNPGSSSRVVLRGATSLNGNNQPLLIIDGIPINQMDTNPSLRTIKPDDIAKIEVIKGPKASALYGVRAINGVITIITKDGKKGKLSTKLKKQLKKQQKQLQEESITNETYDEIIENPFELVNNMPLSTFSIDVDKASYSNIRRMINIGQKIPKNAVKIEEMINYFDYNYGQPNGEHPFAIHTEVAQCPWNDKHQLVKIGLQGKKIPTEKLPSSNLVFLIDVSGSMSSQNKLPLLKASFKLLVNKLREKDKVAIVVYAGAAGVVLEPTSGAHKQKIIEALDNLNSGGSTAGGAGIQLAYKLAEKSFLKKGNNRVILATDGDFNIGVSSDKAMEELIEEKRKSGVFLTVLGFGMGNYKDSKLETLADKGNGNHAYIDTMQEAQKILVKEFGGTLFTIAKDVKIQVEFNPKKVQAYRLIGYENRLLNDKDFIDDTIDAGEIGSGHTVTALYELIPIGVKSKFTKNLPKLKYSQIETNNKYKDELLTVKFRYKKPDGQKSIEMTHIIPVASEKFENTSSDFKFVASVAMFGMQLRDSEFKGLTSYEKIINLASKGKGDDDEGYRSEFIRLVKSIQ